VKRRATSRKRRSDKGGLGVTARPRGAPRATRDMSVQAGRIGEAMLVEAVLDRLLLPAERVPAFAIVGGRDPAHRAAVLDRLADGCRHVGMYVQRLDGREVSWQVESAKDHVLLIDEALLSADLADLVLMWRNRIVLTAGLEEWRGGGHMLVPVQSFPLWPSHEAWTASESEDPVGRQLPLLARLRQLYLRRRADAARALTRERSAEIERVAASGPAAAVAVARVLRELGEWPRAANVLQRFAAADNAGRREQALLLAAQGATARARGRLAGLPEDARTDVRTFWVMAEVERLARAWQAAEQVLRQALFGDADNPTLRLALAAVEGRLGRAADAVRQGAAAVEACPGSAGALSTWARCLTGLGRHVEAATLLERAQGVEPWNPRHPLDRARVFMASADFPAALSAVAQGLTVAPGDPEALGLRAEIEAARGEWDPAEKTATAALRAQPTAEAHQVLAATEERHGRPNEALAHWRRALVLAPSVEAVRMGLRRALERLGRARVLNPLEGPALARLSAAALAAAGPGWRPTWAVYGDEEVAIAVTETEAGSLVATVEAHGRPVEGAEVVVAEVDEQGRLSELASGVTDDAGEVCLGADERVKGCLAHGSRERYRVRVLLPPVMGQQA